MSDRATSVVFFDRDGTLNELVYRYGHNEYTPPWFIEEVKLKQGVVLALKRLLDAKFELVVLTNQPDVAKDKASLGQINTVRTHFIALLEQEGIKLSGYFHCLHHPKAVVPKLKCSCKCRKPQIGMFCFYENSVNVDKSRSWMVGDSIADIQAGNQFGVGTIGLPSMDPNKIIPDTDVSAIVENITQVVDYILDK